MTCLDWGFVYLLMGVVYGAACMFFTKVWFYKERLCKDCREKSEKPL